MIPSTSFISLSGSELNLNPRDLILLAGLSPAAPLSSTHQPSCICSIYKLLVRAMQAQIPSQSRFIEDYTLPLVSVYPISPPLSLLWLECLEWIFCITIIGECLSNHPLIMPNLFLSLALPLLFLLLQLLLNSFIRLQLFLPIQPISHLFHHRQYAVLPLRGSD